MTLHANTGSTFTNTLAVTSLLASLLVRQLACFMCMGTRMNVFFDMPHLSFRAPPLPAGRFLNLYGPVWTKFSVPSILQHLHIGLKCWMIMPVIQTTRKLSTWPYTYVLENRWPMKDISNTRNIFWIFVKHLVNSLLISGQCQGFPHSSLFFLILLYLSLFISHFSLLYLCRYLICLLCLIIFWLDRFHHSSFDGNQASLMNTANA